MLELNYTLKLLALYPSSNPSTYNSTNCYFYLSFNWPIFPSITQS